MYTQVNEEEKRRKKESEEFLTRAIYSDSNHNQIRTTSSNVVGLHQAQLDS